MGDNYNTTPGAEGFKEVIDFGAYLSELHNTLTGRKYKLVKAGKTRMPDGMEQDQYVNELQDSDPASQTLNEVGADYVVGELRQFFNKHTSMGNLVTDERCRKLAADIVMNIVAEILSTPSVYGCSEEKNGMLMFRMATTRASLYMFFTAIRDGKIIQFGIETTGSQTNYNVNEQPQPGVLTLGRR